MGELVKLLYVQDEEANQLREAEMKRVAENARRAEQNSARSAAETLTKALIKHAENIGKVINGEKNVTAKQKNACGASVQVFNILFTILFTILVTILFPIPFSLPQAYDGCVKEVEEMKNRLIKNEYDPKSVANAQKSSRPGKRKEAHLWNVSRSSHIPSTLPHFQSVPVCLHFTGALSCL